MSDKPTVKSIEFRKEREAMWYELEALVGRIEREGVSGVSGEELAQLPSLYRTALSSLSVVRSISLDRNLEEYLQGLCSRAYFCVYAARRRPWQVVRDFFTHDFPAHVYRLRWHLLLATALFFLGGVVAHVLVLQYPEMFHTFVAEGYAAGRGPETSTEELRQVLFDGSGLTADQLSNFTSYLMTHNSRIGMLCFVLGFALGLPVIYLLFENGAVAGAFSGLYASRDLTVELYSWLLPHGVTEILAVLLCGAAGLYIGESIIFPGTHTRLRNLAIRGRQAGMVVMGAVGLFVMAGLIEGVFRQTVQSIPIRYAAAALTAVFWIAYLGIWGRIVGRRRWHHVELDREEQA